VIFFRARISQTIDGGALQTWRAQYLDKDVFHPELIQGVIFGGAESNEVTLSKHPKLFLEAGLVSPRSRKRDLGRGLTLDLSAIRPEFSRAYAVGYLQEL
jgi:hypothetical protein